MSASILQKGKMKVLIVFLVLELTAVAVVDCLKCYSCTNCNDPFEESSSNNKVECPSGQCMKAKGKSGDVQVVARGCSPYKVDNTCSDQEVLGVDTDVCYCDTELCNGSSTVGTSLKWLLLPAAVVVIITSLTH